jgi:hypothetical protein
MSRGWVLLAAACTGSGVKTGGSAETGTAGSPCAARDATTPAAPEEVCSGGGLVSDLRLWVDILDPGKTPCSDACPAGPLSANFTLRNPCAVDVEVETWCRTLDWSLESDLVSLGYQTSTTFDCYSASPDTYAPVTIGAGGDLAWDTLEWDLGTGAYFGTYQAWVPVPELAFSFCVP